MAGPIERAGFMEAPEMGLPGGTQGLHSANNKWQHMIQTYAGAQTYDKITLIDDRGGYACDTWRK